MTTKAAIQNPLLTPLKTTCVANVKLFTFAAMNAASAFRCAEKLLSVRSSLEFADVMTNHARDQFDHLAEHVEELSALLSDPLAEI